MKKMFIAVALAAALAGCSKDEVPQCECASCALCGERHDSSEATNHVFRCGK